MDLTFACPTCAADITILDTHIGQPVTCEGCGTEVDTRPDKPPAPAPALAKALPAGGDKQAHGTHAKLPERPAIVSRVVSEPKGESVVGQMLLGLGLVGFFIGLLVGVAVMFGEARQTGIGAFISGSLGLAAVGAVLDIREKLELIAHRLRK